MYLGCLVFYLTMVLAKKMCMGVPISVYTTPWMVAIHEQLIFAGYTVLNPFICVGVLIQPNTVLTSAKCFNTISNNSQIVIIAGNIITNMDMRSTAVQSLFPVNTQLLENNKIISISTGKSIRWSNYVDVIAQCTEDNCMFDEIGFQYGFKNQRQIIQYDFSNSSALCLDLNEDPQLKYCTHHSCLENYGYELEGNFITKVHKGQSFLMGFWDYDDCEKNIRVFDKLLPDREQYESLPRRKLF